MAGAVVSFTFLILACFKCCVSIIDCCCFTHFFHHCSLNRYREVMTAVIIMNLYLVL